MFIDQCVFSVYPQCPSVSRWLVVFLSAVHEFEIKPNHKDTKNTEVAQRDDFECP